MKDRSWNEESLFCLGSLRHYDFGQFHMDIVDSVGGDRPLIKRIVPQQHLSSLLFRNQKTCFFFVRFPAASVRKIPAHH
ncbi:hypothetical protein AB6A40_002316 [Gnathostoma spinigerum]|uniref:Uncharacterized protein n=1 Tax=Gnathostoma spinigerum TaxID=75299 RepID=A0ABD6EGD3_9BILA